MKNCCATWNGSRLQYKYLDIVSVNLLQSKSLFISFNGTCESIIGKWKEFFRVSGHESLSGNNLVKFAGISHFKSNVSWTLEDNCYLVLIYWCPCSQLYSMRTSSDRRKKANSTLRATSVSLGLSSVYELFPPLVPTNLSLQYFNQYPAFYLPKNHSDLHRKADM